MRHLMAQSVTCVGTLPSGPDILISSRAIGAHFCAFTSATPTLEYPDYQSRLAEIYSGVRYAATASTHV